jgi:hypothetical protein
MIGDKDLALQAGVAGAAVAFLQQAVLRMVPYTIIAIPLIALDMLYGIRAAKYRKETIRLSTAIRRTLTKIFSYLCWIILSSAVALAFERTWLEWVILGLVFLNEFSSVVGNYLETKGLELSWKAIGAAVSRIFGQKAGIDTEGINPADFVVEKPKPAQPRNAKGQFTSKKDVRP